MLPPVQLGELLAEVDAWTGFSQELTHAGGATTRATDLPTYLYASIVTQACNMTLSEMVNVSDLSYQQLLWCTNWHIREETLQAATNVLVDFQYRQRLSRIWGDGTFSSSDGQRFAVARKTNKVAPLPRYFGYGRGLTNPTELLSKVAIRYSSPLRSATSNLLLETPIPRISMIQHLAGKESGGACFQNPLANSSSPCRIARQVGFRYRSFSEQARGKGHNLRLEFRDLSVHTGSPFLLPVVG